MNRKSRSTRGSLFILTILLSGCVSLFRQSPQPIEDSLHLKFSDKNMGLTLEDGNHVFRLFAPSATTVELALFHRYEEDPSDQFEMRRDPDGVWEVSLEGDFPWKYYAYRIHGPDLPQYQYDPDRLIADPWSRAVVRKNLYSYPTRTVILPEGGYDWEGDQPLQIHPADLIILEAHLRDMTIHPSSQTREPGTYHGLVEKDQLGGIHHLKQMGFNAVEFLPLQEFGNIEIDYRNPELPVYNDWNPYETNHWGYMTSYFFAPETYYASDGTAERGAWSGGDGRAVREFKDMVKELHREGIAVIMDVVYNHVSQYDENPFKYIDKDYYFRLDRDGNYLSFSGCGNDFRTESPMARRLIIESLLYWMEEYHVDGFRFDLAAMLDAETVRTITEVTREVNPGVILIGEPWGGGGYNPAELADAGWASWNDHFRNSIKGRSPFNDDYGFIFGKFWDQHDRDDYETLMRGYLREEGGHYHDASQDVNYLESHDDNTLGDFIRLALGDVGEHEKVTRDQVSRLTEEQLQIHRLAALCLLTSQGPVMMHAGQSWGRAKVIAPTLVDEQRVGELDHNSYDKDNETNWLDWREKAHNQALVEYYRGLITLRGSSPALRSTRKGSRSFFPGDQPLSFGFQARAEGDEVCVLLNGDVETEARFQLPPGVWVQVVDAEKAGMVGRGNLEGTITVPAQSGMILRKEVDS